VFFLFCDYLHHNLSLGAQIRDARITDLNVHFACFAVVSASLHQFRHTLLLFYCVAAHHATCRPLIGLALIFLLKTLTISQILTRPSRSILPPRLSLGGALRVGKRTSADFVLAKRKPLR
jgi:hypothetical protein